MAASRIKDMTCLSEIAETASRTATRARSKDTSDTQPQYYADPLRLLINNIDLLNFRIRLRHCSVEDIALSSSPKFARKFLPFAHFLKKFLLYSVHCSCFHFRTCPLFLRCIPRQLSRNETPLSHKKKLPYSITL